MSFTIPISTHTPINLDRLANMSPTYTPLPQPRSPSSLDCLRSTRALCSRMTQYALPKSVQFHSWSRAAVERDHPHPMTNRAQYPGSHTHSTSIYVRCRRYLDPELVLDDVTDGGLKVYRRLLVGAEEEREGLASHALPSFLPMRWPVMY